MPEIKQYSKKLDDESRDIKREALKICWYMRGMSYAEAMHLSFEERQIIGDIIKDNLETTKKTSLPLF